MPTVRRARTTYADRLLTESIAIQDAGGATLGTVRGAIRERSGRLTDTTVRQADGRYQISLELDAAGRVITTSGAAITVDSTMRARHQGRVYRLLPAQPVTALSLCYQCGADEDGGL